jgi:cytochrome P450
MTETSAIPATTGPAQGGCPIDHSALRLQKTARTIEPTDRPLERDAAGVWHVRGYDQARRILRSQATKQAGFKAELIAKVSANTNQPILYQEGQPHHEQRRQTARFFTPKAVSENYRQLMVDFAERLLQVARRERQIDLSLLGMKLAVRVAGEVIGLTNSRIPGMDRRLNAFFVDDATKVGWSPRLLLNAVRGQARVLAFFLLDVKPAIEARRNDRREDVISHLLGLGYSDSEILTECITYGAAGMVTTREFISIATWHLLEQPALRERYLSGDEAERQLLLQEILRLEPVVGHLYRRTTAALEVEADSATHTIPEGSLIDLHLYAINADETVAGDSPLLICPQRELHNERAGPALMAFGDGHHRCPGAYIALQETDIFLQRLLKLDVQVVQKPSVTWNDLIAGYEVRNFVLALK